jgi:hypothetical protein
MGLFPKGQLAYCPKRNMSSEKQRPTGERLPEPPVTPGVDSQEPPPRAAAYIPPMAAPKESRYHTIDMKAVRLSPDIDPQRMKTQLSLRAVKAAEHKRPSRAPAWLALLLVGGAIGTCAWWFSRWQGVQSAGPSGLLVPGATAPALAVAGVDVRSPASVDSGPGGPTASSEIQRETATAASLGSAVPSSPPMVDPLSTTASSLGTGTSEGQSLKEAPSKPTPRLRRAPRNVPQPKPQSVDESGTAEPRQPKLWLE